MRDICVAAVICKLENTPSVWYNGGDNFQFAEMIGVFMNKKLVKEFLIITFRSVYKELHADHETGAADNK